MKINKLNYENFVIDYIEGTLSVELKKDFDLFLEKNADVYEEIKDYISAPILEESNEIFTDKKSLKKTNNYTPYLILALIPFLLIGAYFLIPNKTEQEEIKVQPQEIIQQFAQEKTTKHKEEIEIKEIVEEKIVTPIKKEVKKNPQKSTKKQEIKKSTPFFASNEQPKKKEISNINPILNSQETTTEIKPVELMSAVASLETIPLKSFDQERQFEMIDGQIASTAPKSKSLLEQLGEKSNWMEMVTPEAFEDFNLKESLAIESNVNINTSRKILNAFIPESLVK